MPVPPAAGSVAGRLAALRRAMRRRGLAAYLVLSSDPHLSEYLPGRWEGRRWLSGFTGSVGTVVVTARFAGLWVDSRYWEQAAAQLAGSPFHLMRQGEPGVPSPAEWLAGRLRPGESAGVDGAVLSLSLYRTLSVALARGGAALDIGHDLLQDIWRDRPGLPGAPVYGHLPPHATAARTEKLAAVREAMARQGADAHVLCTLDDIAWLFNLRGADVQYNPVFLAHALVGPGHATLFAAPGAIDEALRAALAADGVDVADYELAAEALGSLQTDQTLLLDPARVTCGIFHAMDPAVPRVEATNPSTLLKSRKNDAEIACVRTAMEADGAALCEFFAWFEAECEAGAALTELDVDEQVVAARARRDGFVSPSFATIAGYNANGAMPHYRATPEAHAAIAGDGLLLIDSGGQYLGGTTDITRVVPVGTPSAEQKRDFTLVLKGMIALSRARFPEGLPSPLLDALARAPIWAAGIEYGHGTGHGVGYFLNVHEGPQVISYRAAPSADTAMREGMITSNEPGIYRPGRWGVRIENLVCARKVPGADGYLEFETLTLCPIDTRCVLAELLDEGERRWLDDYHATVRRRLAPLVQGAALQWLAARTEPLGGS